MCVEIAHLEAVPHDENMRRARLDMCKSGRHDLTIEENVRWDKKRGWRAGCKPCSEEKTQAARDKRRKRPGPDCADLGGMI